VIAKFPVYTAHLIQETRFENAIRDPKRYKEIPQANIRQRVAPSGALSDRLSGIFDGLTRRGALSDKDVSAALREIRRALIEADVALEVVRDFTEKVKEKAVGAEVVKSVTPGQMVVKIVHDELVNMLGSDADPISLAATPPVTLMMVGLQGSGKTTTTAKIAKRLTEKQKKKVLMASLDVKRPAAQEQLRQLGGHQKSWQSARNPSGC